MFKPDAFEVVNALCSFSGYLKGKGRDLAKSLDLPHVGGSDAHSALNVGDACTLVEVDGFGLGCPR